jgi:hypothetical protein
MDDNDKNKVNERTSILSNHLKCTGVFAEHLECHTLVGHLFQLNSRAQMSEIGFDFWCRGNKRQVKVNNEVFTTLIFVF